MNCTKPLIEVSANLASASSTVMEARDLMEVGEWEQARNVLRRISFDTIEAMMFCTDRIVWNEDGTYAEQRGGTDGE